MAFDPTKPEQVALLINQVVAAANQIVQDQARLAQLISECLINNVPAVLANPATIFPAQFTVDRVTLANARTACEAVSTAIIQALAVQQANLDALRLQMGVLAGTL